MEERMEKIKENNTEKRHSQKRAGGYAIRFFGCWLLTVALAVGMFLFWKPDLVWKLTEEWKAYCADEPSEFYLKVTQISGILLALFGIVVMILPFIVE